MYRNLKYETKQKSTIQILKNMQPAGQAVTARMKLVSTKNTPTQAQKFTDCEIFPSPFTKPISD